MAKPAERTNIKVQSERAVLAALRLPRDRYDLADPFGELVSLAEQAGAVIVGTLEQRRQAPVAGTYMGEGKLEELRALCDTVDATLVIFDHDLSPKQISNIEKIVGRKVLDRSELILDVFASRATTHEAKLQVELAQLEYTYPRLRAMWTHLERIVGPAGLKGVGTRGPGETQLEMDRRLVQSRKLLLRRELEEIHARKRRAVRARRRDNFTVGLVGYTNAGKSTLFNTLTAGGAYADDRLFATLMTRTREWDLGGGLGVMLSDTVGFVRDIPPHLIASFRATLEEALHADLLLVVIDVADPAAELHYETVTATLDELEAEFGREFAREGEEWAAPSRQVLLNKVDRLPDNRALLVWLARVPGAIPISSIDPGAQGQEQLIAAVRDAAQGGVVEMELDVPLSDSRTIHTLENRGEVLDRRYDGDRCRFRVRLGRRQLAQIRSAGGRFRVVGPAELLADGRRREWSAGPGGK